MGVPKFFRYISERYPCLSEVVREYQLPEFDNLYLDMNGIIHVCSHPNDTDVHFRITEEKIFRDIFHYIETLFRMIQPQKLFFMAVDGVAPRAKMNQQRGRRFRSAKDAEIAEAKAKLKGEELPVDERFDSNCITPGTEFMTRLQEQLQYFVTFKISTDKLWRKTKVILSGHETPGEGEHKIMDYIRYMKSQPGYDPNTRHCLYGLDADLIMLGLCTHEPHFSLLREEVKYGKKDNQKRIPTPEETTFYLLHLSLMREYLDLEFQQLKTTLPFPYNLENIIDDWVLMGFLVGNDFIPHLPDLHINKGALPILYKTYIDVLPSLGGYINEGGTLRLERFQKYMEKLAVFDLEQFKEYSADLRYFEAKTGRKAGGNERHSYKQADDLPPTPKSKDLKALIASTEEMLEGSDDEDDNNVELDSDDDDEDRTSFAEFSAHKNNYYVQKLEYEKVTPEVLRSQAEGYVRAIQWNLNYYYNGCCSWSWFYPHHYAPYISDIKNFSSLELEYDIGKPFLPFQQLLAVLPAASKKLLPEAYHDLMENQSSPIFQFYPSEFKTDLNGKKQDWEAVVLIPFIEQDRLIRAMQMKENKLTEEEKSRNKHGPMHVYTYTSENMGSYMSPAYFPALANHHARVEEIDREQLYVEKSQLVKGLCPGVDLDVYFSGFPTLKHIPFKACLIKAKVKVFESMSQGDNMILTILPQGHPNVHEVATQLLGKSIFVNWPHMFEARVMAVSSQTDRYSVNPEDESIVHLEMNKTLSGQWGLTKRHVDDRYIIRMGIEVGNTEILVYACTLEDRKLVLVDDKMHYEKQWSSFPIAYALQTTRTNIAVHEPTLELSMTVEQMFPVGTVIFSLEQSHYGAKGSVVEAAKNQRVKVCLDVEEEPNLHEIKEKLKNFSPMYMPGNSLAHRLKLSPHALSRITGTIFVLSGDIQNTEQKPYKPNIGLNLKFNKKNEEVCGYTKRDKTSSFWLYSKKAEDEVRQYMEKFPEVFDYLSTNADDIHAKDLYPEDTDNKLAALVSWLKERGSMQAERQTCGSQVLEEEVVLALEKRIDLFLKKDLAPKPYTFYAKPSVLYLPKPKLGQPPQLDAVHQIFDRITNVRESYTVPLGAKGTIIGIHGTDKGPHSMYDVLFDKEFIGGLKLRCSPHRGYRLPAQAFINLSLSQNNEDSINLGKPTAVVEPSGTKEETGSFYNEGHNSAFASWHNKDTGSPQQYRGDQRGRRPLQEQSQRSVEQYGRNRQHTSNTSHFSAPHQLSNEYLAMFNQLQKAGQNTTPQVNPRMMGVSGGDPSRELKKMLKIADDTSKKQPLLPSPGDNLNPMKIGHSKQLISLHQKLGVKLPKFMYKDAQDGTFVCTVACGNGKEYQGAPAFAKDQAAESAAFNALQCIALEESAGFNQSSTTPPFHPHKRSPIFAPANRLPIAPNALWLGEQSTPVSLPNPPSKWYQSPGGPKFQPEWQAGGVGRANHFPYHPGHQYPPFVHSPHTPHNQQSHYNPQNQNYMDNRRNQKPFIPLQAETRHRYHPQSREPRHSRESAKPSPSSSGYDHTPPRVAQSGATFTPRNQSKPQRSRIAANFSVPINSDTPE